MPIYPNSRDALIVVDLQRDFMPGGPLAVAHGDEIIPLINRLISTFPTRVFTRDWHPANHISFSSKPEFREGSWPPHCVQYTPGAEFHPDLQVDRADRIVSKADRSDLEAYSGFQGTDLKTWLSDRGVQRVLVVGVATDYCVKATSIDAMHAGFQTILIRDAVRAVDQPPGSGDAALAEMQSSGVQIISSQDILSGP